MIFYVTFICFRRVFKLNCYSEKKGKKKEKIENKKERKEKREKRKEEKEKKRKREKEKKSKREKENEKKKKKKEKRKKKKGPNKTSSAEIKPWGGGEGASRGSILCATSLFHHRW